ncbi:MAG: AraC family transcriptional regulator [Sphingobacteriales bacterium]|nr:MAG: AraC family transcriptional regulator [Sphingobacteriales bacterium]
MRLKTTTRKAATEASLSRILGSEAIVLKREPLQINGQVNAESIEVSFKQEIWPEEHARLNLFPVSDDQFCLQVMYLQYTEQSGNARIHWFEFLPAFFEQYPLETLTADLPFRFDKVTEQQFTICTHSTTLLQQLQHVSAPTAFTKALQLAEISTHLLRRALECIKMPFTVCPVPACRFLANDSEREKVMEAKRVIELSFDQPYTIKELSRKVAMNECYLKKGFKALVGKTIHEYQQELRISRAKELLVQPGFSVSDVANSLGYSSISHFSTAFKKATGLKPCELLR